MDTRTLALVAAFMLAGTIGAGAQDQPDKGSSAPSRGDRSESSPRGDAAKGPESGHGQRGQDRQAKDANQAKDSNKEPKRSAQDAKPDRERAAGESTKPKAEASKDKEPQKSSQDKKANADSAKSNNASDKSADKKSDQDKSTAVQDKSSQSGSQDSATGASSGEAGSSSPGKLTEDKKKLDEVKSVQVTGERRDRLQKAFKSHGDIKHETNVDVRLTIGSRAPRSWTFISVPTTVIEVVPEYRGYLFAYVGDDYVICDPDTYEVVALIPASGGGGYASGGGSAQCSTSLSLNTQDREEIIRSIEMSNELSLSGVSVGWQVPRDVELRTFPSAVIDRRSELGACRYFIVDDQIAVVDPDQDKVVLMIEHD